MAQLGDVPCLNDFKFLKNLVVIRGFNRLATGEALMMNVSRNIEIGLASLTTVTGSISVIANSTSLCGKGMIHTSF